MTILSNEPLLDGDSERFSPYRSGVAVYAASSPDVVELAFERPFIVDAMGIDDLCWWLQNAVKSNLRAIHESVFPPEEDEWEDPDVGNTF